jgi:hypothetical protein
MHASCVSDLLQHQHCVAQQGACLGMVHKQPVVLRCQLVCLPSSPLSMVMPVALGCQSMCCCLLPVPLCRALQAM